MPFRTYPQETAAAAKGTFDIEEIGNFMEFKEGRSNNHTATLPLQELGHVFNRYTHFTAVHTCLPLSGFSGDKDGLSRANMKRCGN